MTSYTVDVDGIVGVFGKHVVGLAELEQVTPASKRKQEAEHLLKLKVRMWFAFNIPIVVFPGEMRLLVLK